MRILRTTLTVAGLVLFSVLVLAAGMRLGTDLGAEADATGSVGALPPTTVAADAPTTSMPPAEAAGELATTASTPAPAAVAPTPPPSDGTLRAGDENADVLVLQQRLSELGFWLGEPDGGFGRLTTQAVLAFQKAQGLGRDGTVGPATLAALATATRPLAQRAADGLEISLDRQLLYVIDGGVVRWVLNTSTGAPATPTPPGDFVVQREIDGVRRAPLGDLYRPKYFNGGVAVHGSSSIPGYAASHGCARLSNAAMDLLWASGVVDVGTPVRVL